MVLLDVGTTEKKRRPGENSRNLRCHKRPSHHTYSPKVLPAFIGGLSDRLRGKRQNPDRIYRQRRALVGQLHHRPQHRRAVDARPQTHRAMADMDIGRHRELRTLYLQRDIFHLRFIRNLCHCSYLWLHEMERVDGKRTVFFKQSVAKPSPEHPQTKNKRYRKWKKQPNIPPLAALPAASPSALNPKP